MARATTRPATVVPLESAPGFPNDYVETHEIYTRGYGLPELGNDQAIATDYQAVGESDRASRQLGPESIPAPP